MSKAAVAVIFNKTRTKVLLTMRRDIPLWVVPGGAQEEGETLEQTAIRETYEETGYKIKVIRKVAERIQVKKNHTTVVFEAIIIGGKSSLSSESRQIIFFPVNKLPDRLIYYAADWISRAQKPNSKPAKIYVNTSSTMAILRQFKGDWPFVLRLILWRIRKKFYKYGLFISKYN